MFGNETFDSSDYMATDEKFLKKYKKIYISSEQEKILRKYNIDINSYEDIKNLIFDIEDILNTSYENLEDLEWVSQTLSDNYYYNNVNK